MMPVTSESRYGAINMKEMEIVITPDGEIKIEAAGYSGGACMKDLDKYLAHMRAGGVSTDLKDQKKKPEFCQVAADTRIKTG